jgi:hypothetical protein
MSQDQRIQYLKDDPNVKSFDHRNVVCKVCNKLVHLYGNNYYLRAWQVHIVDCMNAYQADPNSFTRGCVFLS